MGGRVIAVTTPDEFERIMAEGKSFGGKAVVIDFFAEWCGPCKVIAPVLEELSEQHPSITFLKVDVDKLQTVARSHGISAMPTFQSFFNGAKVDELKGADPRGLRALVTKVHEVSSKGDEAGRALGGDSDVPTDVISMRERMAAAAEARLR
ncbi:hypothetical protein BSKO_08861 [Bryopsis sp. KO-2023]|nr:hypothetical protein BSKO_08861 [Bryopsis sp. KO-2023]